LRVTQLYLQDLVEWTNKHRISLLEVWNWSCDVPMDLESCVLW